MEQAAQVHSLVDFLLRVIWTRILGLISELLRHATHDDAWLLRLLLILIGP